jgi:hypothetical protein
MTVDDIGTRLRARLQEEYGVDEATLLMDRPPGGWGDLVTNDTIRRELQTTKERFDLKIDLVRSEMGAMEHRLLGTIERQVRTQTWRLLTAQLAAMAMFVAALAAVARF